MLKLTKKADYGLIALKHLAMRPHRGDAGWGSASAKEIADTYGVPLPLLSKILQKLARAGFLRSEHGTNGGYRLARDPRLITALEVIRAIDGPIILTACFTEHGGHDCHHEGVLRLLSNITISDITSEEGLAEPEAHARATARLYGLETVSLSGLR